MTLRPHIRAAATWVPIFMPRRSNAVFRRFLPALAAAFAMACAQAVELGDVAVRSWIGQPLVADIELTEFSGGAGAVTVKLARGEVFEGASIAVHPALANARMSVMQRDGRQFLHLTSVTPVDTPYVHLFLELTDGSRKNVRAVTLSLSPDPKPAPAPKSAPAPAPEARPTAPALAPIPPSKPAPAPALAPVPSPKPAPAPLPVKARPAPQAPALRPPAAREPAAACPKPRFTDDEIRACAASEYRSALLSAQIVELEEKVKALQAALDAPMPPVPAARAAAPAPRKVRPAVSPPHAPADGGLPLAWIGAGVAGLAAAGGGMLAYRRRRTTQPPLAVGPRRVSALLARLRDALQRDRKQPVAESGARTEPE